MLENIREFINLHKLFGPIIIVVSSIVIYNVLVIILNKGITKDKPNLE